MPPRPLDRLLARALLSVDGLMSTLQKGQPVGEWQRAFERELTKYHTAALLAGAEERALSKPERAKLEQVLKAQFGFLDKWATEIQVEPVFREGWRARAALYAEGVKQSYWSGVTRLLPLPAMPGDGTTQCLTNCRCIWQIVWLDEENGDADATWQLNPAEHCQTCLQRAADWAPLKIRNGELQ